MFKARLAEWSKAFGSGPNHFGGAGSNPAACKSFLMKSSLGCSSILANERFFFMVESKF
jgi:hypothetical protein